jgi:pimeloyl-ACP methyl ester carboxylesterase
MRTYVTGDGPPLVVIPGIHGRWEYMRRTVNALAAHFRVVTFSLADEPAAACPFDPDRPMESYVAQVLGALDQVNVRDAAICGVSFGGLIALRCAAGRPRRTSALILASTPGPRWVLDPALRAYARRPALGSALFFAGMPGRLRPELTRALPRVRDRVRFEWEALQTFLHAPVSPARMGARALAIDAPAIAADAARIVAPTLVIVGEESLDRVVPVAGTSEYATAIPGATLRRLEGTGHQGSLTRPDAFAAMIADFLDGRRHAAA